jgi:hypothetical protein
LLARIPASSLRFAQQHAGIVHQLVGTQGAGAVAQIEGSVDGTQVDLGLVLREFERELAN